MVLVNNKVLPFLGASGQMELALAIQKLNDQLKPYEVTLDLIKQQKQLENNLEAQRLQEQLKPLASATSLLHGYLGESVRILHSTNFFDSMRSGLPYVGAAYKQFTEYGQDIARQVRELPGLIQDATARLTEEGWFFDFGALHIPELHSVTSMSKEDVEQNMADYFREHLDDIERKVCGVFPSRARLIQVAFKSHKNGDYALSIPLFFAQVDGASVDKTGKLFFKKDSQHIGTEVGQSLIKKYPDDELARATLAPLLQTTSVNRSKSERPSDFNGLNRHQVMHGEVLDYDTEINGLKAISLINFICAAIEYGG